MGTLLIDENIAKAKAAVVEAKKVEAAANAMLQRAYCKVLADLGFDPATIVIPGTWDCEESPLATCAYHFYEDPCRDKCVFCEAPEERR